MRLLHCLPAIFFILNLGAAAEPKVIKAKTSEPVVPELMGGCSLKCVIAWKAEVQNPGESKPAPTKLLNDETAESAWIAPAGSTGVGTRFRLLFGKKLAPGLEGQIPLYGIDLINGNWKDEADWKAYGRLKRARLFYNERVLGEIAFADSRRWAKAEFPDTMLHGGDVLTLEVLEVYPGTKAGLALSEIVLQGGH